MIQKGSVVLVPFPFTDLSGSKVRPAVVIGEKSKGDDIILVFISSVTKHKNDTDILLSEKNLGFKETGLKVPSLIKCSKIATLEKQILLGEIGKLSASMVLELNKKLKQILDL